MNKYTKQVDKLQYNFKYVSLERWNSYYAQICEVIKFKKFKKKIKVLEIGVGTGILARELENLGIDVTTIDIDSELSPDIVASITDMSIIDNDSYDLVVAFEVLEHIQFMDISKALLEMERVSRYGIIISVPNVYPYIMFGFKFPLVSVKYMLLNIPIKFKKDKFDGEHYWEIGRKNYSYKKIIQEMGKIKKFLIKNEYRLSTCPFHHFIIFKR